MSSLQELEHSRNTTRVSKKTQSSLKGVHFSEYLLYVGFDCVRNENIENITDDRSVEMKMQYASFCKTLSNLRRKRKLPLPE